MHPVCTASEHIPETECEPDRQIFASFTAHSVRPMLRSSSDFDQDRFVAGHVTTEELPPLPDRLVVRAGVASC
jgi:hypothetical protein